MTPEQLAAFNAGVSAGTEAGRLWTAQADPTEADCVRVERLRDTGAAQHDPHEAWFLDGYEAAWDEAVA